MAGSFTGWTPRRAIDVAHGSRLAKRQSGEVAQSGERGVRNAEVEGSIPFFSTPSTPESTGGFGGL